MKHPYSGLPDYQFWNKEPGITHPAALDPVVRAPFRISPTDKIVTAGSCFAQHVARYMSRSGYNHYITEKCHPIVGPEVAEAHHYGLWSARYGNIYTARQLKQLLLRAWGMFEPATVSWPAPAGCDDGAVVDPFRPQIQPGGFASEAELLRDRRHHFACLRKAILEMDVFVFNLGLTEGWEDPRDGAVFPLAPGVAGGVYDPDNVNFVNFDETQTFADLHFALKFIRNKNPSARFVLAISPVPLAATYEDRHALVSTGWSKAVLRIAAEKAVKVFDDCAYFPSYELTTSPHVRGAYYDADCREVLQPGVDHVMRLFMTHYGDPETAPKVPEAPLATGDAHTQEMEKAMAVLCDVAAIDNS